MQQSMANLANFQQGQTPSAQFAQVSGASGGPVQFPGGGPTASFDPNSAAGGYSNALGVYGGLTGYLSSQANPWMAGLSSLFSGAGSIANTYGSYNKVGTGSPGGATGTLGPCGGP
jgi:hypothetical protein